MKRPSKKSIIWLSIAFVLLTTIVLFFTQRPSESSSPFNFIPDDAIFVGVSKNLRGTWREQIQSPAVQKVLISYNVSPKKLLSKRSYKWISRVAIGDTLVSSVSIRDGQYVVSLASPTENRHGLVKFFLGIRYFPGAGFLKELDDGTLYVNVNARKSKRKRKRKPRPPLYLSLALHNDVLLAQLAPTPTKIYKSFITDQETISAAKRLDDSDYAHSFMLLPSAIEKRAATSSSCSNVVVRLSMPSDTIRASLEVPLGDREFDVISPYIQDKLSGKNLTAEALAANQSFLLTLLPSSYISQLTQRALGCNAGTASDEDAAIYFTCGPTLGGQLAFLPVPALTADIPGIDIDNDALQRALEQYSFPSAARKPFTTMNGTTISSSATSLAAQRSAALTDNQPWREMYSYFKDDLPSFFIYIKTSLFMSAFTDIYGAMEFARTLGVKIDEGSMNAMAKVQAVMPKRILDADVAFSGSADSETKTVKLKAVIR